MARFNELLGVAARLSRLAARVTGTQEQEGVTVVGPELLLALVLEMDRPEWKLLGGTLQFGRNFSLAAAAALPSTVRIRNPVGTRAIVIVSYVEGSSDVISDISIRSNASTADLATAVSPAQASDLRAGTGRGSIAIVSADNVAGSGIGQRRQRRIANQPATWELPANWWVLAPGSALDLTSETNLSVLTGSFGWYERREADGELES